MKLIFTIALLICSASSVFGYTPPIGIPDPGMWGSTHPIDSQAPNPATKCPDWPSAQTAGCYYIDNTHPQATDTTNTYGYPDKPRSTIPAKTYEAGAYVEINGGPYTGGRTMLFPGTTDNPIWVVGGSATTKADVREKWSINDSSYVVFEHLDFNTEWNAGISMNGASTNHICVRYSTVRDIPWVGVTGATFSITPTQGGSLHDFIFYNNIFDTIGNYQATEDEDWHVISPNLWGRTPPSTVYNIWVLENTGTKISGNMCQFNGDYRDFKRGDSEVPLRPITNTNLQNFHHFYFGKNYSYENRQSLGAAKMATDIIFSQNKIHDNLNTATTPTNPTGTGGAYQEGSKYVWYIFNEVYNEDYGFRQSNTLFDTPNQDALYGGGYTGYAEVASDLRSFIIGNKIYNIRNINEDSFQGDTVRNSSFLDMSAWMAQVGFYTRVFVDNTVYNVGTGISLDQNRSSVDIHGNVFAGVKGTDSNGLTSYHLQFLCDDSDTVHDQRTVDYNFFEPHETTGTVSVNWDRYDGESGTEILTSLAQFKAETGQCTNCLEGDPLFVDAENYDLHPAEGSPLIGKGTRHSAYDLFYQRYGIDIDVDFDGNARPPTGRTLGAFEYDTGYAPTPVDGACGSANGQATSQIPSANLCNEGDAGTVALDGSVWEWQCNGRNNGNPALCSAPYAAPGGGGAWKKVFRIFGVGAKMPD